MVPKMLDPPGATSPAPPLVMAPTIANGLLCSILRALTRDPDKKELAAVINREMSEGPVTEAWKILFSYFSDAMDKSQKKRIIDIARETTLKISQGYNYPVGLCD